MNNLPEDVAKLVDWIPRKRYLELYGETNGAVLNRIARKQWVEGVQYSKPPGGGMWISIKGVNAWASGGGAHGQ
jgi:hypothetical protein